MYLMASDILKLFNEHYMDFINDVLTIYPNDYNLKTGKTFSSLTLKVNPSLFARLWITYITPNYDKEIENEDISFFAEKDYSEDLKYIEDKKHGMGVIEELKKKLKEASPENQKKSMKYVKNLNKLCKLYYQHKNQKK